MSVLTQESIDRLHTLDDRRHRLISCGVDPKDSCLYLVTCDLDVRVVRPNGGLVPESAFPAPDGRYLGVVFRGSEQVETISSEVALRHSSGLFATASLTVNDTYMGDLVIESVEVTDENKPERPEEIHSRGSR
jgi:hypothetical protein